MDESTTRHVMSRRAALRAGGLGVGVLWVAPAMQVVGMTRADAASQPPPQVRDPQPEHVNDNEHRGPKKAGGNKSAAKKGRSR